MPLVSLFVRPSNITTSTLLQTLSIMAHLARRSGNQLTYVQAPREPDAQRLLNFSGMTVGSHKAARSLISQSPHRIAINQRVQEDAVGLLIDPILPERGVSLAQVAALVGLKTALPSTQSEESGERTDDDLGEESALSLEVKVEKRQTASRTRPSRYAKWEAQNHERVAEALNEFGGFAGRIRVA